MGVASGFLAKVFRHGSRLATNQEGDLAEEAHASLRLGQSCLVSDTLEHRSPERRPRSCRSYSAQ